MLVNLHVKNLALIEEADIDFKNGLNILSGETGAGKSILIDSIHMALGGKIEKSMLREDADYALVELVFQIDSDRQLEIVKSKGITVEENQVVFTRKIIGGRSIKKINGETVSARLMQELAGYFIDIYGQHEYRNLMDRKKHMDFLDDFAHGQLSDVKALLQKEFKHYKELEKELTEFETDEETRKREIAFAEFEYNEIQEAGLRLGEDEELEKQYRKMNAGRRIADTLSKVYGVTGYDSGNAAGEQIGLALKQLEAVAELDDVLEEKTAQLRDIDGLLNDFNRELSNYMSELDFSQEEFYVVESRLDEINRLKAKYGKTIEQILAYGKEKEEELQRYADYDSVVADMRQQLELQKEKITKIAAQITAIRKKEAEVFVSEVQKHMQDLNFLNTEFDIVFHPLQELTANGAEEAEFMVSMNLGEPLKPIEKVASGGELSRIMLAIKTLLADREDIGTLIFDEIDTGISGRTAQKVSEKMALIGQRHQLLCITHLPQIAAMADAHFLVEKSYVEGQTRTRIDSLSMEESCKELARMLGGAEITDTVMVSAKEMKQLADTKKQKIA